MKTLFTLLVLLMVGNLHGQQTLPMSYRVYDQNIWLRWQTTDMASMKRLSDSGFYVYRQLIEENGKTLAGIEIKRLTAEKVVRMPESIFENIAKTHPSALLALQCLTGDIPENESTLGQTINKLKSDDWCLLSSSIAMNDHFETALAAGFGFIDNTAKPNSVYVYTIEYALGKDTIKNSILVHTANTFKQLQPVKPSLGYAETNKPITISFPSNLHYWGYELEKSHDGIQYKSVYQLPFVQTADLQEIQMTDSIHRSGYCYYRYRGIDEFGQRSDWSDTAAVYIENIDEDNGLLSLELVEVQKDFILIKTQGLKKPSDISIYYADSLFGNYSSLAALNNITDSSIIRIDESFPQKYLMAVTSEFNGRKKQSLPLFVQREDNTPPMIPALPSIHIEDQTIHIFWRKNTDPDLLGYRVYRGDKREFEFMPVHTELTTDTVFTHTLAVGTIRDSIFYAVTAIDKRYNESHFSEIAAKEWNDNIPPPPAIIQKAIMHDGMLELRATVPKDKNIERMFLYRIETGQDTSYTLISTHNNPDSIIALKDSSGTSEKIYGYHLICQDKWGLNSPKANDFVIRFPERKWLPAVAAPFAITDTLHNIIHLHWSYPLKNEVSHYRIYAHTAAGQVSTIGTCNGTEEYFAFHCGNTKQTYTFTIVAYSKNGRKSK